MATALTAALAPYVQIMEQEISADLARIVPAEKLRDEVRKTLVKEISAQTMQAISELHSSASYGASDEKMQKDEAKAGRFIGYLQSLLVIRDSQRLLAAGEIVNEVQS